MQVSGRPSLRGFLRYDRVRRYQVRLHEAAPRQMRGHNRGDPAERQWKHGCSHHSEWRASGRSPLVLLVCTRARTGPECAPTPGRRIPVRHPRPLGGSEEGSSEGRVCQLMNHHRSGSVIAGPAHSGACTVDSGPRRRKDGPHRSPSARRPSWGGHLCLVTRADVLRTTTQLIHTVHHGESPQG